MASLRLILGDLNSITVATPAREAGGDRGSEDPLPRDLPCGNAERDGMRSVWCGLLAWKRCRWGFHNQQACCRFTPNPAHNPHWREAELAACEPLPEVLEGKAGL